MEAFAGQELIVPIVIIYPCCVYLLLFFSPKSFTDELKNKTGREVTVSIHLPQGKII